MHADIIQENNLTHRK